MTIVQEFLVRVVLTLLCAGSLAGILLGAGLLWKPERVASWNQYFSGWISADKVTAQLDRPRWIERYFYRHHRLAGALLSIGAIFVLYALVFNHELRRVSAALPSVSLFLWDALVGMLLVGSVLAALIGVIVLVRPSLLREIEKSSNRWISTEGIVKLFDGMNNSFDQQVLRHRAVAGVIMIIGGIYILINVAPLLWRAGLKF
jgi:uncharacterized membrane protein